MAKTIIWHNPRCTKSRQTLEILNKKGLKTEIREYLKDTPSANEIKNTLKKLKINVRDLMRKKEAPYKDLNLENESNENKLIQAMVKNPVLIERPVVFHGPKAVIGRPPENVKTIL